MLGEWDPGGRTRMRLVGDANGACSPRCRSLYRGVRGRKPRIHGGGLRPYSALRCCFHAPRLRALDGLLGAVARLCKAQRSALAVGAWTDSSPPAYIMRARQGARLHCVARQTGAWSAALATASPSWNSLRSCSSFPTAPSYASLPSRSRCGGCFDSVAWMMSRAARTGSPG